MKGKHPYDSIINNPQVKWWVASPVNLNFVLDAQEKVIFDYFIHMCKLGYTEISSAIISQYTLVGEDKIKKTIKKLIQLELLTQTTNKKPNSYTYTLNTEGIKKLYIGLSSENAVEFADSYLKSHGLEIRKRPILKREIPKKKEQVSTSQKDIALLPESILSTARTDTTSTVEKYTYKEEDYKKENKKEIYNKEESDIGECIPVTEYYTEEYYKIIDTIMQAFQNKGYSAIDFYNNTMKVLQEEVDERKYPGIYTYLNTKFEEYKSTTEYSKKVYEKEIIKTNLPNECSIAEFYSKKGIEDKQISAW